MMQTMDSKIGLDFIVENPEYIRKLAAALDTNNVIVKKQVFELLSALCVHNEEGHARALDTLEHYKKLKGERYRLNVIVQELDQATAVDYQTALVAFINCLIISTPRLTDRVRRRNEFIGCHLLPVLNNLRKCAEAEPELAVQLDVFDEQRESDDAQCLQGPHGVDLNSPLDVFYAILKQVAETPQEVPFLSILQHLLRIDSKDAVSDIIWDTAERLVHRATLLENRDDASRLLRAPSAQSKFFCHCQLKSELSPTRRQSLNSPQSPPPAPVPPSLPPPPPPPPAMTATPSNIPPPAPAPPPHASKRTVSKSPTEADVPAEKLPQQEIPAPKSKMKTFNWNKIPNNKVVGRNNVWTQVAFSHQHSPMADMDWLEMEGLFCQQTPSNNNSSGGKSKDTSGCETLERRMRKENCEITLLDGKRSLNVNIFLKQFRSSNEDIIQLIREGEHDDIGSEKLKGLLKILPEVDELDMLKSFNGDFSKLGNAEKFLIQLTNLSNYKLRIESMLLKEEFACNMSYLEPSIKSMIMAARDLMTNKPLQEVLYMILVVGNFLNSGGYAGNAAGVKLSSLQKITDIRANKPNMNMIHFVALQAQRKDPKLLTFTNNINVLEDAAKTTVEQILNEINVLDVRIKKIKKQIDLPSTESEIKHQMTDFLQMAEREVANLQRGMSELERVRTQLSEFFCEDNNSFKLEECFRIFHGFYCKFKQAVADNERRRIQEEQANARRRQREELLASKRRQMEADSEVPFIDLQIYDSRHGFPMKKVWKATNGTSEDELSSVTGSPSLSRRRLGSFNGVSDSATGKEEKSPDITPNGSLRRRRSRVLSEEDEGNLMDFLRASGQDSNRERRSWGSLDRSWARKARGGSQRKRPALLGADFTSDRERPSSPSPLSESKPIVAPVDETKPKDLKQKIESWLQASENDQNEDSRRQARRLVNRRSLEMDSESERSSTLDTLPEGKQVYSGSQSTYRKVYPAWLPSTTIDNTDVVSAMEAVEEAQPQIKDKSAWRKSTLNVANSTEATKDDSLRHRPLMQDTEDNPRKSLISSLGERSALDKLTLYIRPNEVSKTTPTRRLRDSPSEDQTISNKVEIDQDNIETPPATRKVFIPTPTEKREPTQPSPCRRLMGRPRELLPSPEEPDSNQVLGDGQFDRFSATRRTRRYKRNPDNVDSPPDLEPSKPAEPKDEDREVRLKTWQSKLKTHQTDTDVKRRYRNQTGINQDDVKNALLKATEKESSTTKIDIPTRKSKEHDNDEGFEESQSLMSESPSQGASSGGNYEAEDSTHIIVAAYKSKPNKTTTLDHKTSKNDSVKAARKSAQILQRNSSTRRTIQEPPKKNPVLRRSGSLRKTDTSLGVEKSSSRSSIVSSRSSLNSATSTNTVKRVVLKPSAAKTFPSTTKPVKRTPSSSSTKPPKPQTMSFMKPTTSSATKIHSTTSSSKPNAAFKSRN